MNDMPMTLFAWGLDDMRGHIFLAIRAVAGVVAFVIGWYLSSPCWRLLYRLVFRQGVPGGVLGPLRLCSAGLLGAGVFFFLPLGGGSGWGWGSGSGGGPGNGTGTGTGTGSDVAADPNDKTPADGKKKKAISARVREKIEIELLGGSRYELGSDKYYLLKRKEPAQTLDDVEKYLVEHKENNIEVHIILTESSVTGPPLVRLDEMLDKHRVPHEKHEELAK